MPGSASSGGSSTYMVRAAGAKEWALLTSCTISLVGFGPPWLLAHLDTKYLIYSTDGVATNSSGLLSVLISLATILER